MFTNPLELISPQSLMEDMTPDGVRVECDPSGMVVLRPNGTIKTDCAQGTVTNLPPQT